VQENMEEIKDSGDKDNHLAGKGIIRQMLLEEKIEQEEVVRIITDLFIAAADTTSHATQWALYLLAKNPECQEKLLNQVNEVTQGRPVEEKDLPQLSYVKGVIKEALR
jgi:cytochrome P450